MAIDLTDVLLKRQADKYTAEQFGPSGSPTDYNLGGGNFVAGFNQGMNNLIKFAQTGDRRRDEARQEAIAAEQVGYEREQDLIKNQLAMDANVRADKSLGIEQGKFNLQKVAQTKADQEKLIREAIQRNTATAQLAQLEGQAELDELLKKQGTTTKDWINQGYVTSSPETPNILEITQKGKEAGIEEDFTTMQSAADLVKTRNLEEVKNRLTLAADTDPTNDYGQVTPYGVSTATDKVNAQYEAQDTRIKKAYEDKYKEITKNSTPSEVKEFNEYEQFAKDWKGGDPTDIISPYVGKDKSEEDVSFQREELTGVYNRVQNDNRVKSLPPEARDYIFHKVAQRAFGQGVGLGDYSDTEIDSLVNEYVGETGSLTKGIKQAAKLRPLREQEKVDLGTSALLKSLETGMIRFGK